MSQYKYATATAFRRALEDRLKTISKKENLELQRLRREVAFDRFLARLFSDKKVPWVLKGGYAMELQIKEARVTRDIDLVWREIFPKSKKGSFNERILSALQDAASLDLSDHFVFIVSEQIRDLDNAPYAGARFPVEVQMDGRNFVNFHLDVAAGDVDLEPLDVIEGRDWLSFARIPRAKVKAIPKEQQFAEKVHAYTQPRPTTNTRVRDLVDMVLLIRTDKLHKEKLQAALKATFRRRESHSVPTELRPPPENWKTPFAALARDCGLPVELEGAYKLVSSFFIGLKA